MKAEILSLLVQEILVDMAKKGGSLKVLIGEFNSNKAFADSIVNEAKETYENIKKEVFEKVAS